MEQSIPSPDFETLYREINELASAKRTECLWFIRTDYLPETNPERLNILKYLEKHGDRETFKKARILRDCLLQLSKEKSASSSLETE